MGERLLCKQEVIGSIPFTSTTGRTLRGLDPGIGRGRQAKPLVSPKARRGIP